MGERTDSDTWREAWEAGVPPELPKANRSTVSVHLRLPQPGVPDAHGNVYDEEAIRTMREQLRSAPGKLVPFSMGASEAPTAPLPSARQDLAVLKARIPDYTCPEVEPVIDFLRAQGREDLIAKLVVWQRMNVQLRSCLKEAIRIARRHGDR